MPVPVAERMLKLKTALSTFASATTGGTFWTSSLSPATGTLATQIWSREARTCGAPHRNTMALKRSQGVHAVRTAARLSRTGAGAGGVGASDFVGISVMGTAGRQTRRKSARLAIETMAATMSTSQGP